MTLASPHNRSEQSASVEEKIKLDAAVLEVLASRICHDLISPVGAVHNGVEFLQETGPEAGSEAVALIAHSAEMAAAKLQAFRLAYGAGGRDPNLKPEDVYKTFDNLIRLDAKIAQSWNPKGSLGFKAFPAGYCKTLMGALLLAQECLPKGGTVSVQAGPRDNCSRITAQGTDAGVRQNVREALARTLPVDTLDPRLVHPYVISALAASYGLKFEISEEAQGRIAIDLFTA